MAWQPPDSTQNERGQSLIAWAMAVRRSPNSRAPLGGP